MNGCEKFRTKTFSFILKLQRIRVFKACQVYFAIGGADGHDSRIYKRADFLISFGAATWPHMLFRAMIAEQLYRANAILLRHPYHRDN